MNSITGVPSRVHSLKGRFPTYDKVIDVYIVKQVNRSVSVIATRVSEVDIQIHSKITLQSAVYNQKK